MSLSPRHRYLFHTTQGASPTDIRRLVGGTAKYLPRVDMWVGYLPPARLASLSRTGWLEWSEPDRGIQVPPPVARHRPPASRPWGVDFVDAPAAWPLTEGEGTRVAVIDTGIDYRHPNLTTGIGIGVNLVSPGSRPQDDSGHGTHVAGTIAARTGARTIPGLVGVAPAATIYPVKAFDRNGMGSLSWVVEAIDWCIAMQASVVNMSFGLAKESQALSHALAHAARAGLVLVAAAGNRGQAGPVDWPARYPEVLAITALARGGAWADFSSRGQEVALAAPGHEVVSSWPGRGHPVALSGTSMACPHVTGVAALILGYRPRLPRELVHQALIMGARRLPHLASDQQGAGVVSATGSLGHVNGKTESPAPTATPRG